MTKLISKFDFDRKAKMLAPSAQSVVREALYDLSFAHDICYAEHRDLIGRMLLGVHRPDLIGVLSDMLSRGKANEAIEIATEALHQLRGRDPLLFWGSKITKEEAGAWMRRQHVGRDRAEIDGITDRAGPNSQECWNYRYEAAHTLAERGEDPIEIWRAITSKQKRDAALSTNATVLSGAA